MLLPAEDPLRKDGLVYLDGALVDGPATHVLIIGVGAYKSPQFKIPLTSTTVSARALADWFVDGAKPHFQNKDCPLGSVAVLLSEPAVGGGNLASYAGGDVPRATLANCACAVKAWVRRINTNKDNLAILYVASHGESFLNQTAFLLEDYGLDDLDKTSGMSKIEQLAGALENAKPVAQLLLFDCCRVPTDMRLPWNEELGTKLISLTRADDDHGEPRKQWMIAATSLGEVATGRSNKTTLFADALINALDGVAADPAEDGWPVRPGTLVDKIDSLLALHRLPSEKAQTPSGRMAGSFEITFAGEKSEVPVYVSFNDPAEWPDSVITVTANPGNGITIQGVQNESPFRMMSVPTMADVQASAVRNDESVGSARKKAYAPAIFLELRKVPQTAAVVVGALEASRGIIGRGKLTVALRSPVQIGAGAVADIVWRGKQKKPVKQIAVPLGGEASLEVQDGDYTITLRTPDGRVQTKDVQLAKDTILKVEFSTQDSPHEWLATAAVSGAVGDATAPPAPQPQSSPFERMVRRHLREFGGKLGLGGPAGEAAEYDDSGGSDGIEESNDDVVTATIAGQLDVDLVQKPAPGAKLDIAVERDDGLLMRFDIRDGADWRYMPGGGECPLFAVIKMGGRQELAVVPTLGARPGEADSPGGWTPYILIDRTAGIEQMMSTVIVEDSVWAGLLGFVASRDMIMGEKLLDSGLVEVAVSAFAGKRQNPLAALAGALVAVAAASADVEKRWEPWLRNLADWFPGLPDGPIILGRRLLMRARNAEQIAEARKWLFEGFDRGVPVYSLCVDWLARGLESLGGDEADLKARKLAARHLANRVDPTRAFTVIRLDD
ncbi:caspase family protein [Mesorhizobium sp. RCC_202]|uniref:caspase family protein n=1 Tax=Mesorhizobium sp. RCC_202 TaxID=3239222 RepID=UPI003523CBE4